MSGGSAMVSPISSLRPGREAWKVVARVLRVWECAPIGDPSNPYALQILLIDSEVSYLVFVCEFFYVHQKHLFYKIDFGQGMKIEVSIRKAMIRKFKLEVSEGKVYKIIYFSVVSNDGKYRASTHDYKILFTSKTKISQENSEIIPRYGFSFTNAADVKATGGESAYMLGKII